MLCKIPVFNVFICPQLRLHIDSHITSSPPFLRKAVRYEFSIYCRKLLVDLGRWGITIAGSAATGGEDIKTSNARYD